MLRQANCCVVAGAFALLTGPWGTVMAPAAFAGCAVHFDHNLDQCEAEYTQQLQQIEQDWADENAHLDAEAIAEAEAERDACIRNSLEPPDPD